MDLEEIIRTLPSIEEDINVIFELVDFSYGSGCMMPIVAKQMGIVDPAKFRQQRDYLSKLQMTSCKEIKEVQEAAEQEINTLRGQLDLKDQTIDLQQASNLREIDTACKLQVKKATELAY